MNWLESERVSHNLAINRMRLSELFKVIKSTQHPTSLPPSLFSLPFPSSFSRLTAVTCFSTITRPHLQVSQTTVLRCCTQCTNPNGCLPEITYYTLDYTSFVTISTYRLIFIYFTQCTDTGVIVTHALSFYRPLAPLFLLTHAQLAVVTQSCALLYITAHCDLLLQWRHCSCDDYCSRYLLFFYSI